MGQFLVYYAFVIAIVLLALSVIVWLWIDRSKIPEKAAGVLATFAASFLGSSFGFLLQNYKETVALSDNISNYDDFFISHNVDFSMNEFSNFAESVKRSLRGVERSDNINGGVYLHFSQMTLPELQKIDSIVDVEPFREISLKNPSFRFYLYSDETYMNSAARRFNSILLPTISQTDLVLNPQNISEAARQAYSQKKAAWYEFMEYSENLYYRLCTLRKYAAGGAGALADGLSRYFRGVLDASGTIVFNTDIVECRTIPDLRDSN